MDKRTTRILLVILASVLCGLPGIAGLCIGPLAIVGSLIPESDISQSDAQLALIIGIIISCLSLIFIAIPIVTGYLTRGNRKPKQVVIVGDIPEGDF